MNWNGIVRVCWQLGMIIVINVAPHLLEPLVQKLKHISMAGFGGENDELVLHVGQLNALTPMFIIQDICSSMILIPLWFSICKGVALNRSTQMFKR